MDLASEELRTVSRTNRMSSLLDSVAVLALLGILAGAIGGFAVGLVTKGGPSSSSSSSAH